MMVIRIVCAACGAKLDAPERLAGKKGKCPKCGDIFQIPTPEAAKPVPPKPKNKPSAIQFDDAPALNPTSGFPKRIHIDNIYVILSSNRVIAFLKYGEGWQLNVGHGFANAKQENSMLPEVGDYVLVEGNVKQTDNGRRLVGIQFFKIGKASDLQSLTRDEAEILEKLVDRTTLTGSQKKQLLLYIRERFFSSFTEDALDVIEYLTGEDFHSQQVGDCQCENTVGLRTE
ncbi:MAG: hypothetical protein IKF77_06075 [Thermoguttaceae bacterium]|nr:hypothetical protein [Thermoguttaceae bacterium]MBR2584759.1 hypothetical protein [Thermoguttaceae bacterium]MBR3219472.1 hypothetical protein [Thermoguttaceae bacterium]